jgi:hypothetical protein
MASYVAVAAAGAAVGAAVVYMTRPEPPSGFLAKVAEADAALGTAGVLSPQEAKELIDSEEVLLVDVQDPGSDMIAGSVNASLGTLPFKASTDLEAFKEP